MARLTDAAGETSGNVPRPRSNSGNDDAYNGLRTSLCRCGRLKRLILNSNRLLTLPDAIHYLRETLEVFEVENNPQLRFPPKPIEIQK
ncbi:unnamed protein product, partial [Protopolystoma xenopodis]